MRLTFTESAMAGSNSSAGIVARPSAGILSSISRCLRYGAAAAMLTAAAGLCAPAALAASAAPAKAVHSVNSASQGDLTVSAGQNVAISGTYDNITIQFGGRVVLNGDLEITNSLVIESNGTLNTECFTVTGAGQFVLNTGGRLSICHPDGISASGSTGAIQVTGNRSFGQLGIYIYNGTAPQVTGDGLPSRARELHSSNPTTLQLSNPLVLTQGLRLYAGTLNTGNQLTLRVDGGATAFAFHEGGTTTGNVKVERMVFEMLFAGTTNQFLASPVQGQPLAALSSTNGNFVPVLNTAYNTAPNKGSVQPFPNVFAYDFNLTDASNTANGWFVPTGVMQRGRGYSIRATANDIMEFEGALNGGSITYNIQNIENEALGLAGNPYHNVISWDLLTKNGLYDAYYVWQGTSSTTGRYGSYVNGVSTNDVDQFILPEQSFFVSTSAASASITFTDAAALPSAFLDLSIRGRRAAKPLMRLELAGTGNQADESVVYFDAAATAGFDGNLDAKNMPSSFNLYTHGSGKYYSINAQPESFLSDGAAHRFALGYTAQNAGTYTIKLKETVALDGQVITLIDNQLGTATVMNAGDVYSFQATAGANLTRFVIQIGASATSAKASILSGLSVFPNPAKDRLDVSGLGQNASLMLINSVGQTVRTATASYSTSFDLNQLAAGVYTLRIAQEGQVVNQKVVKE